MEIHKLARSPDQDKRGVLCAAPSYVLHFISKNAGHCWSQLRSRSYRRCACSVCDRDTTAPAVGDAYTGSRCTSTSYVYARYHTPRPNSYCCLCSPLFRGRVKTDNCYPRKVPTNAFKTCLGFGVCHPFVRGSDRASKANPSVSRSRNFCGPCVRSMSIVQPPFPRRLLASSAIYGKDCTNTAAVTCCAPALEGPVLPLGP